MARVAAYPVALPRWKQSPHVAGRKCGVVLKILTAAVFCFTIASIITQNVSHPGSDSRVGQESHPVAAGSSAIPAAAHDTAPVHVVSGHSEANAKTKTVSNYIQDKITKWRSWQTSGTEWAPQNPRYRSGDGKQALEELIQEPFGRPKEERPVIIKVMMLTAWDQSAYERALRGQEAHNRLHGYAMNLLRQPILSDVWSKPAYILSCLLRELAKAPGERAQWLFWFDADTIILNPNIPLEVFLPPATFDDINLLVGHDWNGLNNGVYPVRVHPWSVELLTTILTYPIYRPDEELPLRDQTAMAEVLKMPRFSRHTAIVPMKWFNGYHRVINETADHMLAHPGDLLVHLAGVPDRFAVMEHWLQKVDDHSLEYEIPYAQTAYKQEIRKFWEDFAKEKEVREQQISDLMKEADELEKQYENDDSVEHQNDSQLSGMTVLLDKKKKIFEDFYMKQDLSLVRNVTEEMKEVSLHSVTGPL